MRRFPLDAAGKLVLMPFDGLRVLSLESLAPSHPKMGFLVKETADRAAELLRAKEVPA